MNFLVVLFAVVGATLAAPQAYRPPSRPQPGPSGQQVAILKQSQEVNFDGSYQWSFDAENGISAQESGVLKNPGQKDLEAESVQGSVSYTAPDGTPIALSYTADENGFQPQGAHLPTPPPIPEAIQRALDYIRSQPPQGATNNRRPF